MRLTAKRFACANFSESDTHSHRSTNWRGEGGRFRSAERTLRICSACYLTLLLAFLFSPTLLFADQQLDEQFPPTAGTTEEEVIQEYVKQISAVAEELKRSDGKIPPTLSFEDDQLAFYFDAPNFAQYRTGGGQQNQKRFLLGRLVVMNKSDEPLELNPREIELNVDARTYQHKSSDEFSGYAAFRRNHRHYNLTELDVPEKMTVPAEGVASCWVVFFDFDTGRDAPQLKLTGEVSEKPFELDLRQLGRAELKWKRETIGPAGVLAVGRIRGRVHSINLCTILDELVILAQQDISRVIIHFDEDAEEVDPHLVQWFEQASRMAGQESQQNRNFWEFPPVTSLIRELHLSNLQGTTHGGFANGRQIRKYENLHDAVVSAGQGIYDAISLDLLLKEIEKGHLYSRCAALIYGADRLPRDYWPKLEDLYRNSDQLKLREAALTALGEFPSDEPIGILIEAAQSEEKEISQAALMSLGGSRFPEHHDALLKLLEDDQELQPEVVKTMARFPRQLWAKTLFRFVETDDVELRREVLQALNVLGHPQLFDVLAEILKRNQEELVPTAFNILNTHEDPRSRELLIDYALEQIRDAPPNDQSLEAIRKYRVQEAIPILLEAVKKEEEQRRRILQTLSAIGDSRVVDPLIELFPELPGHEQHMVVSTISELDEKRFLKFAPEAMKDKESRDRLASTIVNQLQNMSSDEAIEAMIEITKELPDDESSKTTFIRSLGGYASDESRRFLRKLRDNSSEQISQAAAAALESSYSRSPVSSYYRSAVGTMRSGNVELAVKQFGVVLEMEPDYPLALESRGQAYQRLDQTETALADYQRLLKIDPRWPEAQGTTGQLLTALFRFEEAKPHLDRAIEQEPKNARWYSSRGHVFSMLEQFEKAEKDYRKALEIEPNMMTALTGIALSLAIEGKIDEAIKQLDDARAQHEKNAIFAYNAACTYARALEYQLNHADEASSEKEYERQVEKLRDSAFEELKRSVELGYDDVQWTKDDPDLKILQDDSRFEKMLKLMEEPPEQEEKEDAAVPKPVQPE